MRLLFWVLVALALPFSSQAAKADTPSDTPPATPSSNPNELLHANGRADLATGILQQLEFPVGRKVSYQEQQMNPMLKHPVTQQGFVEITADGDFVMQVTKPRLERRRLNNGTLSLQRPSRRALRRNPEQALNSASVRTLTLNPKHSGHLVLLTITQVLDGDTDALHQNFHIRTNHTSDGTWSLELQPKNLKVQKRLLGIELSGMDTQLRSLHTKRNEQDWQRITFDAVTP